MTFADALALALEIEAVNFKEEEQLLVSDSGNLQRLIRRWQAIDELVS